MLISKEKCKQLGDLEIIHKALEEVDFFSCLFDRYEGKLMRYIKNLAPVSHQEAEDILQDSFISIWKHLNEFDNRLSLSSWIYRIVHNQTISALRKRKSYGKDRTVEIEEATEVVADMEKDTGVNKEELIRKVLDQLPLMYKEVLVLKFLENMRYEDISDILKIPEGTVATRINRAKKAFQMYSADLQLETDEE
ncbi:MAG: RNA polymerase sigma factor [Saprospiraceae bacterium]|nr:RNA polymerase sigma factor [Saprospiraceae bacterium]